MTTSGNAPRRSRRRRGRGRGERKAARPHIERGDPVLACFRQLGEDHGGIEGQGLVHRRGGAHEAVDFLPRHPASARASRTAAAASPDAVSSTAVWRFAIPVMRSLSPSGSPSRASRSAAVKTVSGTATPVPAIAMGRERALGHATDGVLPLQPENERAGGFFRVSLLEDEGSETTPGRESQAFPFRGGSN